jgi:hypothetical protein
VKTLLELFSINRDKISSVALVILSVLITVQAIFAGGTLKADEAMIDTESVLNEGISTKATAEFETPIETEPTASETTVDKDKDKDKKKDESKSEGKTESTKPKEDETKSTKATKSTEETEPTIPFATAIPPNKPVDYTAQWNAGYLVAIDNPDTTYQCTKVKLSDSDRGLLERLCMGEFATGGFVGAALVAQAVKDAICFDGYTSVAAVIKECRYTGTTKVVANEDCKKAVEYIFDQNKDAVQHRIMYMYNPSLVQSAFHESQNYIMTYQGVRFFDRWGY